MNIINIDFLFFDYLFIILTVVIVLFSIWKGFINSILGILTWVGSVFITIYTYEIIANYLNNILLNIDFLSSFEQFVSIISIFISIPLIFLLSLFFLKRIRKFLSQDLDRQILGLIIDKFLGAVYGIVFTYIVFSTLLYFTNNNNMSTLNNINQFLIQNSNILNQIDVFNNNVIEVYSSDTDEN